VTAVPRKKSHSGHETTDAFAEGWDAREQEASARFKSVVPNPYRAEIELISQKGTKRAKRQVEARLRNVELWDQGWQECGQDVVDKAKRKA